LFVIIYDILNCSVSQLTRLPADLHLSPRHLITSGTKAVMAKHLHNALHTYSLDNIAIMSTSTNPLTSQPQHSSRSFSNYSTTTSLALPLVMLLPAVVARAPSTAIVPYGSIPTASYII